VARVAAWRPPPRARAAAGRVVLGRRDHTIAPQLRLVFGTTAPMRGRVPLHRRILRHSSSSCTGGDVYTHGHHDSVVAQHASRTATNSAAFLLPQLPRSAAVLDVGCGPGSITVGLAQHVGPQGRVVGVDVEASVLQQAAEAARAAGLQVVPSNQPAPAAARTPAELSVDCPADNCGDGAPVHLSCESVYELKSADDSFDCAYAHQTLQHLSRPVDAIREMARVVSPPELLKSPCGSGLYSTA
jgi:SAM-dependent methyltransferase